MITILKINYLNLLCCIFLMTLLSCRPGNGISVSPGESFQPFFETFQSAAQSGNLSSLVDRIRFPLEWEKCFEGDCETSLTPPNDFYREFRYEPLLFVYPLKREQKGSVMEVHFGYEARFYTLQFMLLEGKWVLVKIKTGSC